VSSDAALIEQVKMEAGMRVGSLIFLLILSSTIMAGNAVAQDPEGTLDSIRVECGANSYTAPDTTLVSFKIKYSIDNTGSNRVSAIALPLILTGNNIVSVDTGTANAFSGSGVGHFGILYVEKDSVPDPTAAPFHMLYMAIGFGSGVTGDSLFVNVTLSINDTGTICIDTLTSSSMQNPTFVTESALGYAPGWAGPSCCQVGNCNVTLCGDVDGSGAISASDIPPLVNYLHYNTAIPNACNADVDDYGSVTIRDILYLVRYIFQGGFISCPPSNPELQPTLASDDTLRTLSLSVPADSSHAKLTLYYSNQDSVFGFALPLKVTIDGNTPTIDSVVMDPRVGGNADIDTALGTILILNSVTIPPGADTFMTVFLSFTSDAAERVAQIDTVRIVPSNYPLFLVNRPQYDGIIPVLEGFGPQTLAIQAFSPVDLHVIDPDIDSLGPNFNDFIQDASYNVSTDEIYIPRIEIGKYQIKVLRDPGAPPNESTYTITVRIGTYTEIIVVQNQTAPQEGEVDTVEIAFSPSTPYCTARPGDANADLNLSLADAISMANYVLKGADLVWLTLQLCRGDVNGDGQCQLQDVIRLVNFLFQKACAGPGTTPECWKPVTSIGGCCIPIP
jgi:hypothetical protein